MNKVLNQQEEMILAIVFFAGLILAYLTNKYVFHKMSNYFKINYVKISLIVGCIIILFSYIIYFYVWFVYGHEYASCNILAIPTLVIGMIIASFGCFMTMVGGIEKSKPIRYSLKQTNYEEFSNYLKEQIGLFQFKNESSKENLNVYKKQIKKKIYYVIDIRIDELTKDNFEELYHNQIFPIIEDDFYQVQEEKQYKLNVTLIISVNRITSMFNQFIKSEERDKRYYKFPVGVSFGGNQLYLPGIDTFQAQPCKSLRKQIKDILELED